jgi:hypothetical protein
LGIFERRNPVETIDLSRPGIVGGQGQFLIPIIGMMRKFDFRRKSVDLFTRYL